jgi:hypothetical protein
MERKFVVRYQGGSGGFLVSWLLQLAHDQRKSKSPSHAVDALNRFPLTLKNKPLEWKNHELTPPDIGILCNSFYDLYENHFDGFLLEKDVHELLQRTINKDTKLYSVADFRMRVKYYHCNYIIRRQASNPLWGIAAGEPVEEPWIYDGDNIMDIIKLSDLLFDPSKVLFVTTPYKFLRLCEDEKVCGEINYEDLYTGNFERNIYITDILNNYKNKLNMFPIESIWEGTWQEHIEKFINRELTAHQIQVCKLLIGRWLYVTPQSIKDEFNI